MKDGDYDSKKMSETVGGCAMNTCRSAHFYLQALLGEDVPSKILTLGSIGNDDQANWIEKTLVDEKIGYDVFKCEKSTGQCAVTVVKADRTCVAVLDACEQYPTSHLENIIQRPESNNFLCLYTTGFFINTNYEALMIMAKFALD